MLDPLFENPYVLVKIPKEFSTIHLAIKSKADALGYSIINLDETVKEFTIPSNLKAAFIFNDNTFETGLIVSTSTKYVSQVFILSEVEIQNSSPSFIVFNPRYKKISEEIGSYFASLANNSIDYVVEKSDRGFNYVTYGNISINPYKGLFIALDHPNLHTPAGFSGSFLAKELIKYFDEHHIEYSYEYEPTGELLGGIVKNVLRGRTDIYPDTMQLLFTADRIEHMRRIYKKLKEGKIVLVSRFALSTLAYSYKELPLGFLLAANSQVYWPDINLVVKYKPQHLTSKLIEEETFEREKFDYEEKQTKVNEAFNHLSNTFKGNVYELDGSINIASLTKQAIRIIKASPKFKNLSQI